MREDNIKQIESLRTHITEVQRIVTTDWEKGRCINLLNLLDLNDVKISFLKEDCKPTFLDKVHDGDKGTTRPTYNSSIHDEIENDLRRSINHLWKSYTDITRSIGDNLVKDRLKGN